MENPRKFYQRENQIGCNGVLFGKFDINVHHRQTSNVPIYHFPVIHFINIV